VGANSYHQYERDGDTMRLYLAGHVDVAAADVVSIEPEDVFLTGGFQRNPAAIRRLSNKRLKNGVDQELISSVISAESGFIHGLFLRSTHKV